MLIILRILIVLVSISLSESVFAYRNSCLTIPEAVGSARRIPKMQLIVSALKVIREGYLKKRADLATEDKSLKEAIIDDLESDARFVAHRLAGNASTPEELAEQIEDAMRAVPRINRFELERLEIVNKELRRYLYVVFKGTPIVKGDVIDEAIQAKLFNLFTRGSFDIAKMSDTKNGKFAFLALAIKRQIIDFERRKKNHAELDESFMGQAFEQDEVREVDSELLKAKLGNLSPELKQVIELKYFQSLTIHQISELLSIPEGTVKSRLSAALKQLRFDLDPRDFEDYAVVDKSTK